MTDAGPRLLQLKILLRDVHPAVWRRVRLADELSIAELHRVIQILMGWDDDHLHRFRIHSRDYGFALTALQAERHSQSRFKPTRLVK